MPDEQLDPMQDLGHRISESIANSPAMENLRRQIADYTAAQMAPLNEAVRRFSAARQERIAQQYTRIMAPALEASTNQLARAIASLTDGMRTRYADIDTGFRLDVSRLDLDAVLAFPFDALPAEQRESARRAVDEATAHIDTAELADEVPDEVLHSLADSARTFASAQPGGLSRAAQKKLFIGFVVTVFFLLLLQAQIESDAVKEFVEDAGGAMLIVAPTALGAAYVWDQMHPDPDDEDAADDNA
ncbi:hypothetical protein ACF09I_32735 [Streptomyces sp. NPDC014940]|uniref:hypothetical protein n=1 Tax=Streptomyces sp. NPDC014940 TaxID=3364932 RepID=UPI0036F66A06